MTLKLTLLDLTNHTGTVSGQLQVLGWQLYLLGWPKSLFGFFHNILEKNPNELFGQTNNYSEKFKNLFHF